MIAVVRFLARHGQIEIAVAVHVAPGQIHHTGDRLGLPGRRGRQSAVVAEIDRHPDVGIFVADRQIHVAIQIDIGPGHA